MSLTRTVIGRRLALAVTALLVTLLAVTGVAAPAQAAAPTAAQMATSVFNMINAERAANRVPALTSSPQLRASAHAHNLVMSRTGQLSHQLPGERNFADRITATGYPWSAAGENVAYTTNITLAGAQQLQTMMYTERAPNDGHRRNILSSAYRNVGVDIYIDAKHRLWLTEDFGRLR